MNLWDHALDILLQLDLCKVTFIMLVVHMVCEEHTRRKYYGERKRHTRDGSST